jgi:hypothetical protein
MAKKFQDLDIYKIRKLTREVVLREKLMISYTQIQFMERDKMLKLIATYGHKALPDELNPIFTFSMVHTEILIKAATNKIDLVEMAKAELKNRGYNEKGIYVGFNRG